MKKRLAILMIEYTLIGLALLLPLSGCQAQALKEPFGLKTSANHLSKDFDFEIKILQLDNENFQVIATMDLEKGSYIISPFSNDNFYLPYSHTIANNDRITPSSDMIEFPVSSIEVDTFIHQQVRFNKVKTVFTQAYKILEQDDFQVQGLIEFLVEPSCIPYDFNFEIKNESGVLSIENEKLSISAEYNR